MGGRLVCGEEVLCFLALPRRGGGITWVSGSTKCLDGAAWPRDNHESPTYTIERKCICEALVHTYDLDTYLLRGTSCPGRV